MKFLKKHAQTILLVLVSLWIVYSEANAVIAYYRWEPISVTNPFFVAMGKWGIRFLLISLAITPIYALTGWRFPIKLRKPTGLLAFAFLSIHVGIYLLSKRPEQELDQVLDLSGELHFILYGIVAFVILAAMALTSVKPAMKFLGKFWKPLHRLVYVAAPLMLLHSLMATKSGKRAGAGGKQSAEELQIYLVILVVLLLVRVPIIRDTLRHILPFVPNRRKPKRKHYAGDVASQST